MPWPGGGGAEGLQLPDGGGGAFGCQTGSEAAGGCGAAVAGCFPGTGGGPENFGFLAGSGVPESEVIADLERLAGRMGSGRSGAGENEAGGGEELTD